jgi:two-component system cell cycle response regulator
MRAPPATPTSSLARSAPDACALRLARPLGGGLLLWSLATVAVLALPSPPVGLLFLLGGLGATGLALGWVPARARSARAALELGVGPAVFALLHLAIVASGGLDASFAVPLLGLWMALVAAFARGRVALLGGLVGAAPIVLAFARGELQLTGLLVQLGSLVAFGALSAALHRGRVLAMDARQQAEVAAALEAVERDARDLRLVPATSGEPAPSRTREAQARIRQLGSVRTVKEALLDVLSVACAAVRADHAYVFLLDERGERLKLGEGVSARGEPPLLPGVVLPLEGALGAVVRTGRAVGLSVRGNRGLGYPTTAQVGSVLALPVVEERTTAGVLVVDRRAGEPFTAADEALLRAVAREVQRALEAERIFAAMDREKYEQERFYEAFSLLNEALSVDAFAERLIEASARIKVTELFALTLFDAATGEHTVAAARAREPELLARLRGATFSAKDGGLVESALKTGHTLPYVPAGPRTQVFGRLSMPELASVKVFPLIHQGEPLGALVLGSFDRPDEVTREEQRMLETVVAHATTTLANARLFAKMEAMATTDGLTGLTNRRRFQELLGQTLARAARFRREVSVLMVDADHFKAINDTHGHPVGDLVLQRIARLLRQEARRTDVVARYGGEEFVVILDESGAEGAEQVAERIRQRIAAEVIQGEFGRLRVTASLGLATWPAHGETPEALLERADQALYEAKRGGRNRVVSARVRARSASPQRSSLRRSEHVAPPPGGQL